MENPADEIMLIKAAVKGLIHQIGKENEPCAVELLAVLDALDRARRLLNP